MKCHPLYNFVDTSVYVLISGRLAGVQLHVEEIALSTEAQVRKLEVIMTALNESLGLNEEKTKWNVKREPIRSARHWLIYIFISICLPFSHPNLSVIHSKDLLATLHLLVAMARRFQPDLVLPAVSVEVVQCEVINIEIIWMCHVNVSENTLTRYAMLWKNTSAIPLL